MKRWGPAQLAGTVAISLLLWAALAGACLLVGSTGVGWPTRDTFHFRLEMVLLASLVGAALSAAGVAYQSILRNPLAEPYLLGVSSGASLAAYLWRFPAIGAALIATLGPAAGAISQQAFAFAGALAAVFVVFALASRRGRVEPVTLLLVGVIVNSINGSIYLLINALSKDMTGGSGGEIAFLVGVIQTNLEKSQVVAAAIVVGAGWLVLSYLSGQLNAAVLSEAEAEALGVRIHRLRWGALIVASLMTASAVAVSGPIGFVGLVAPHVARLLVGHDQRKLLPVATALGAGLLALADAASRLLAMNALWRTVLPVGILTGLLGGPFFLFLLWQSRRRPAGGQPL
jgi:iron complex transport system permease protein